MSQYFVWALILSSERLHTFQTVLAWYFTEEMEELNWNLNV